MVSVALELRVIGAGQVDAAQWSGVCRALLRDVEAPTLLVARMSGRALSIGRWQNRGTVLAQVAQGLPWSRRVTGGRAVALGEGMFGVALGLPSRSSLLPEAGVAASRFINRMVRGVLQGLGTLGVSAKYFGRDYISVESSQAGLVGFDVAPDGCALLECVLAAETHWWLPEAFDALPPRAPVRGVPGPGHIGPLSGRSSAELAEHLGRGYAQAFGVEPTFEKRTPAFCTAAEPSELPLRSALHPIPAGFVEVQVALSDGRIAQVRLCGDFQADSAGIARLEAALVGQAPVIEAIAAPMNDVYRDAAHTILGVESLEVFATAIVEASRAQA